jgi:outer membrane receptor protein involved in Fe transport
LLRNFDASDVIVERSTGALLRETSYEDETKTTLNPSVGVVFHATEDVSLRSSAYRAFRAPTISELYEGFIGRDGTVTVGNAELEPEVLVGVEAGVDYHPDPRWTGKVTAFWNEVDNSIAQHTIGFADPDEATVIPPCDLIPAGGVCRQTDNVGRIRSRGVELEGSFRPWTSWLFTGSYTFDESEVIESDDPALVGKRVRQVPLHTYVLRASFDRPSLLSSSIQGRFVGDRFEDDLNTLPIADFFLVDVMASRKVTGWSEIFITVENLFDVEYEVRATTNGMVEIGAPRIIQAGVRLEL